MTQFVSVRAHNLSAWNLSQDKKLFCFLFGFHSTLQKVKFRVFSQFGQNVIYTQLWMFYRIFSWAIAAKKVAFSVNRELEWIAEDKKLLIHIEKVKNALRWEMKNEIENLTKTMLIDFNASGIKAVCRKTNSIPFRSDALAALVIWLNEKQLILLFFDSNSHDENFHWQLSHLNLLFKTKIYS